MKKKIDNLNLLISRNVYEPAEDSFLLTDNVKVSKNSKVLEIGPGSGYVSIFLAQNYPSAEYFSIDINYLACKSTLENSLRNNCRFATINADLFSCLHNLMRFDFILFNSPYLPVTDSGLLAKAWSGGKDGLEIVTAFIDAIYGKLALDGLCYLVVSSHTNISKLENHILKNNLRFEVIDSIKEGRETIFLYEIRHLSS